MNWKCFLGFHKFKKTINKFEYERDYEISKQRKVVREVETILVCERCGLSKIKVVNYDYKDIDTWRNFK